MNTKFRAKSSFRRVVPTALVLAVTATLAGPAAAAGRSLFQADGYVSRASVASTAEPLPARLLSSPTNASLQWVQVDASAVSADEPQLQFELQGQRFNATQAKLERLGNGDSVWYGNLDSGARATTLSGIDPLNSVILVRSGDRVTGTIRSAGQLYRLRPVGAGRHVLIEVDERRLPADHPAAYERLPTITMPQNGRIGAASASSGSPATIRVLVVASNDAVAGYGEDLEALAELAVAESNQGYTNSNVGITLELAGYQTTDYDESGDFDTDLTRFRGTNDGYMDEIHDSRDDNAADVAVILLDNGSYCGLASGIGSDASSAFASVYWDCATGYYSFAHEIGHLQSARHNIEADPTTTPYAFGHGYRYGNSWRTIMAYDCTSSCSRLNYWSNPNVSYAGVPMGTASSADNQRVLVETKATVAAFR